MVVEENVIPGQGWGEQRGHNRFRRGGRAGEELRRESKEKENTPLPLQLAPPTTPPVTTAMSEPTLCAGWSCYLGHGAALDWVGSLQRRVLLDHQLAVDGPHVEKRARARGDVAL